MTRRLLVLLAVLFAALPAEAAPLRVVALGASNTYGKGVPRGADYPAQLERMLRSGGLDVRVANAGINGDTTAGMLARLDRAVPAGTNLVILQPGGNDQRKGAGQDTAANVAAIASKLAARNIAVVRMDRVLSGMPAHMIQADGQHLTPEGYGVLATRVRPEVEAALRR